MPDGVHFTKAGQRKLAHYVERELVRLFDSRPGKTPRTPQAAVPEASLSAQPGNSRAKPLAGPVVPLTQVTGSADVLAGAPDAAKPAALRLPTTDPTLASTLIDGRPVEAVPGRADDFRWPPPSADASAMKPVAEPESAKPDEQESLRPVIAPSKDMKKTAPPAR
jgi:hypothetical protein